MNKLNIENLSKDKEYAMGIEKTYPRILVISHNAFNENNNMGNTLMSFLHGWDKKSIAQLYFVPSSPDFDFCNRYFCITDYDIARSILKKGFPGKVVFEGEIKEQHENVHLRVRSKKGLPIVKFLRNSVWNTKKWKTERLYNWIKDFNPEIVFYAAGDYNFSMKLAMQVKKDFNIPMFAFFGDDYYLVKNHKFSIFGQLNQCKFRKTFKKFFDELDYYITASDKMENKYKELFNKEGKAMMRPAERLAEPLESEKIVVSYVGNIGCERWRSIVELGNCLADLGLELDVYAAEKRKPLLKKVTNKRGVNFHGGIPFAQVKEVIARSTIVVHLEAMTKKMGELVRYSMSTKIPDSLCSGVCLLAYGPSDVASIEYLKENNAACVVTDKSQLKGTIKELIENEQLRKTYIANATVLASIRHDKSINEEEIYQAIKKLVIHERKITKVLQINNVYAKGSTGRIVKDIHSYLIENKIESYVAYGRGKKTKQHNVYKFCSEFEAKISAFLTRITGLQYAQAVCATLKLIRYIKKVKPDVIHIHCINGYCVNIYRLFRYIKKKRYPVVLTEHAEFFHTGSCGHAFECNNWLTGCGECPSVFYATKSRLYDSSKRAFCLMKKALSGMDGVIAPVSNWLGERSKQSPIMNKKSSKQFLMA